MESIQFVVRMDYNWNRCSQGIDQEPNHHLVQFCTSCLNNGLLGYRAVPAEQVRSKQGVEVELRGTSRHIAALPYGAGLVEDADDLENLIQQPSVNSLFVSFF